jgi:hypothetical protein
MTQEECQKEFISELFTLTFEFRLLTRNKKAIKISEMITTLKVNAVGYIFPPERACHRLRAGLGFRCITKFGTGVAFKISVKERSRRNSLSSITDKKEAGSVPL